MTNAFDDRQITLTISVDGETFTYNQDYYIVAAGTRFTNGNFGECALRIDNISKKTRDFIATKTTTWLPNRTVANISLSVGRASYGTFQLFSGQAVACNPTQPPDIGLTIKSLSSAGSLGVINSVSAPPSATVKSLCQLIAANQSPPLALDFEATNNPQISNYHFNGAVGKQIKNLNDLGVVNAYQDGETLVVTDLNTPRKTPIVQINSSTGLIGVPEVTELGARVRMLINNEIKIGSEVQLTSSANPAVNGNYFIVKLMYEISSREVPFYWIMDLKPSNLYLGANNG